MTTSGARCRPPVRALASGYGTPNRYLPTAGRGTPVVDERWSGPKEIPFVATPGYRVLVACDDVSIQAGAGLPGGSGLHGARVVVPCRAGEISGPFSESVRPGERVVVAVVAPLDVAWHLVVIDTR